MRRSAITAVSLLVAAFAVPTWAIAQTTTGTTTTTPTAPGTTTGTTTGGTGTTVTNAGPPRISTLRLRKIVNAQQGHARLMLGLTSRTPATITVSITGVKEKKVVRTITSTANHAKGAVWFLVQAVNDQGYQLPAGAYRVAVTAKDSRGRTAGPLKGGFTLRHTPPRGRLDGYVVPNLPAIARQMKIAPGGQLVTALGPKGALVAAGLRRGDVITKINNLEVSTPGQWSAALKTLPADTPFPVEYRRGAEVRTGMIQVPPDWTPAPDYSKSFTVLVKRNKSALGYLLASARDRIDAAKPDLAQKQLDSWPAGLRRSGIGQMLQGEILLAKNDLKGALAAYNRATAADPALAPALLGKGLVLSRLDRTAEAVPAFQAAAAADPGNAIAQAFLAYALIATKDYDGAVAAATQAATLDPRYEDGPIAHGLALIALGNKRQGVANLKKGLLFMSDQKRAEQLILEDLEPNAS